MKNNLLLFAFILTLTCLSSYFPVKAQNSCTNNRYRDDIFTSERWENHAVFANVDALYVLPYVNEGVTFDKELRFDFYQPAVGTDTLTKRPLVILVFGGAFLVGWKQQPQLVDFAEWLTRKGFCVAAIEYRLGFNALDQNSAIRAVYRATQDVRAAVRYFRHFATTYKIDPNRIFAGGNSAGGIASIHAAYVTEAERAAAPIFEPTYDGGLFGTWTDLGCLDCSGNSYTESGTPNGVVNLWGAIGDVNWMNSGDVPIISVHGGADNIVNPDYGAPFSADALFPSLYGSIPITARANAVGITNEFLYFPDAGHEVWVNSDDAAIIHPAASNFLYNVIKPVTPTINGNINVCGGTTETYSIAQLPNTIYCWEVSGGSIVSANPQAATVTILWQNTTNTGSISARQINQNAAESEATTLSIAIINPQTPLAAIATATATSAQISWDAQVGVTYEVRYRIAGSSSWQQQTTATNSLSIPTLQSCTTYEWQVRALCGNAAATSGYSPLQTLTTSSVNLQITAALEGAILSNGTMRTALQAHQIVPANQPYTNAPWYYNGNETLVASLLPAAVDWVLVEIWNSAGTQMLQRHAALLQTNGSIISASGSPTNGITICEVVGGQTYKIVVRHRNHIAVMSQTPILFNNNTLTYDFTTASTQATTIGITHAAQKLSGGRYALYAGDIDGNGQVNSSDFNLYFSNASQLNQYKKTDANVDAKVTIADFNLWQSNLNIAATTVLRY